MQRSETNPILRDDELVLLDFRAHHPSRGNTAVICLADGERFRGVAVPGMRERLHRPYRRYEIDLARHSVRYDFSLPASEEAFRFQTVMYLTWSVHDPVRIARLGVRDAKADFWPFLGRRLRTLSRRFSIEDSALAEAELNNDLKAAPFILDSGIAVLACSVHIGLDDRARDHVAARTEHRWTRERELAEHELRLLRDQHAAEMAELRHRIERQTEAHQLELKRLRMGFYREALDHGGVGYVILQLIEHPEDITGVVAMLEKRDDDSYRKAREVIKELNGTELYNQADLDPIRQQALRRLCELLGPGVSGSGGDHQGQADPGEKDDQCEDGDGGRPS
jgi:hypothetical protein